MLAAGDTHCMHACTAGIETLPEDSVAADAEWPKLLAAGLLEPWNDVKDKWQVATDEFKVGAAVG